LHFIITDFLSSPSVHLFLPPSITLLPTNYSRAATVASNLVESGVDLSCSPVATAVGCRRTVFVACLLLPLLGVQRLRLLPPSSSVWRRCGLRRSCLQHDLLSCCCCRRFLILIGLGSGAMARLRSGSQLGSSCSLTRVSSARASRLVNVDLGQPWLSRTVRLVSRLRLNFGL
jgi:hypothetical protein